MGTDAEVRKWLLSPARVEALDSLMARTVSLNLLAAGAALDVCTFSNLCAEFVSYDVPSERAHAIINFSDEALETLRLFAPDGVCCEIGLRLSPTPRYLFRASVRLGLSVLDAHGNWVRKEARRSPEDASVLICVVYPVNVNEPLHWTDVLPEVRDG